MQFRRRTKSLCCRVAACCALVLACLALIFGPSAHAVEQKHWALTPYRIQLTLVVDTTCRPQAGLAESLQADLEHRISTTLHPLWSVEFAFPEKHQRREWLTHLASCNEEPFGEAASRFDKLMILTVTASATGYELKSRELDCHTLRWGPVLRSEVRQSSALSCRSFELLRKTFAPIALVQSSPGEEKSIELIFKGSALPRQTDEPLFSRPGDVYQPLLVRTSRTGELLAEKIREISWTYLTLTQPEGSHWGCEVHSGLRRPFSRRRGRIQQLAIALRGPPAPTRIRFYAKHDESQSLAGYEVFERTAGEEASRLLGLTDAQGSIVIVPGHFPITTLLLRSDGQLLAKIPVAAGALRALEIPIADDTARLRAQSELTALREQLVDLVARRNILISQAKGHLSQNRLDEAQKTVGELDNLLGRAQFDRLITSAEQNPRNISADPRVQARIEKLFTNTRKLLGRFLSAREISDLQGKIHRARRSEPET